MNCAICMSPIAPEESSHVCLSCEAPYHSDCWEENRGCAVYGCSMVPATDGLKPLDIPPAFWGHEEKDCPTCGKQIKAMAVRCRYCGAQVEAKIESKPEYEKRLHQRAHAPQLKNRAMVFLILALLPILAIIPAVLGRLFYRRNREEIRRLPASYDGYYRMGIAIGTAQIAILAVALMAWWMKFVILAR